MSGIQYLTDEQGRRVAVQIDLRLHAELWEEFEDTLVANSRRTEKNVSLDSVKASLALAGKLRD
ncbi:MAG: hypothetical protein P4L03_01555 [Terracidiphilus sp.]|nr:hypothetical protein [Terracidiphilus sp.]